MWSLLCFTYTCVNVIFAISNKLFSHPWHPSLTSASFLVSSDRLHSTRLGAWTDWTDWGFYLELAWLPALHICCWSGWLCPCQELTSTSGDPEKLEKTPSLASCRKSASLPRGTSWEGDQRTQSSSCTLRMLGQEEGGCILGHKQTVLRVEELITQNQTVDGGVCFFSLKWADLQEGETNVRLLKHPYFKGTEDSCS